MIPGVRSVLCSSASDLSMKYNLASEQYFTSNNTEEPFGSSTMFSCQMCGCRVADVA